MSHEWVVQSVWVYEVSPQSALCVYVLFVQYYLGVRSLPPVCPMSLCYICSILSAKQWGLLIISESVYVKNEMASRSHLCWLTSSPKSDRYPWETSTQITIRKQHIIVAFNKSQPCSVGDLVHSLVFGLVRWSRQVKHDALVSSILVIYVISSYHITSVCYVLVKAIGQDVNGAVEGKIVSVKIVSVKNTSFCTGYRNNKP